MRNHMYIACGERTVPPPPPRGRHDSLQQIGPDGEALETQAIEEQSLSNVLQSLVKELNSGQPQVAPAAAAPAGEAAEEDMAVVSLADGTDNPS